MAAEQTIKICEFCGESFDPTKRYKRKPARFCSPACFRNYQQKKFAEDIKKTYECARCGNPFSPKPQHPTRVGKFCSLYCAKRGRNHKSYKRINDEQGRHRDLHRVRAEAALGRPLPNDAIVHHVDGTLSEDSQLVICQDNAYHKLLHSRMRVKAAGGNPNTDAICGRCKQVKPLTEFGVNLQKSNGKHWMCRLCTNASRRLEYTRQRSSSQSTAIA